VPNYTRTVRAPDTFGMLRSTARRQLARANGTIAAEQGRHAGGPCPAVALATLTGRSYQWAFAYLNRRTGYTGRGEYRPALVKAAAELFGAPVEERRGCGTLAAEAGRLRGDAEGLAFVRGHVMPIRRGRVLNASRKHMSMCCEGVVLFDIAEVRE